MSDNDPIKGLTSMVKIFKKTLKIIKTFSRKIALCNKNLAKIPLSLNATWHFKPHSIMYGNLEL
jgi:hypothetical protein